jgi:hypothetical protein
MRGITASVIASAVLVSGCGSATKTATETTAESSSASTAAAAPAAPVTAPPGKTLASADSSCKTDKPSPPINLTGTTVSVGKMAGRAGESAQIRFAYTGTVPTTGSVLWSLTAANPEGKSVQAGWKTVDGQRSAYFYFPNSDGQQQDLDGLADENTPGELGIVMPQAALDILGPTWWWSSAVSVDGKDIATCGG